VILFDANITVKALLLICYLTVSVFARF